MSKFFFSFFGRAGGGIFVKFQLRFRSNFIFLLWLLGTSRRNSEDTRMNE